MQGDGICPLFENFLTFYLFFSVGGEQVAWHKLLLSAFSVVASIWKSFPCNQTASFYMFTLSHTDRNCCVLDFKDAKYFHCSVEQVMLDLIYKTFQYRSYLRLVTKIIAQSDVYADCSINWVTVSMLGKKSKCQRCWDGSGAWLQPVA